ncbi:Phd_YefM protein [Variibacter gotjawalensis]|uniref:Antitoxin n=1 Tax=Variibacter gotjawalensis TaxID=1333996 RepID=A0A0S3PWJ7_9BRAD|nr:type II toxin-antitoxin system Phd/YefM family antitoxin [Variibacter gotjawalensis]NIK46138.1 prevent-host-death family protein [Variibacter gotjawalensis]RZS48056.1 prevent-host-death family protein [Variibacter gotjawalensis]BAT60312.1 Phd_YefM protein [Variibacter gotjawalensis]
MKQLQLRDAKSALSAVVEDAENGKPTTITKHGRKAAVVISYDEWVKLKKKLPTFAELLIAMPELNPEDLPKRKPARVLRSPPFK